MIRHDALVNSLSADFQRRYEPNFAWKSAASQFLGLPGLRGFWSLGAFDGTGDAIDLSSNGRLLTLNGNPEYAYSELYPFCDFDGTGDYFARADEAGLDITGSETYVTLQQRGLTMGGWFARDIQGAQGLMGKAITGNYSYALRNTAGDTIRFRIWDAGGVARDVDGTSGGTLAWEFIVGVCNPYDERLGIFINGTWTTAVIPALTTIRNQNSDFAIGSDGTGDFNGQASLCFLCATALATGLDTATPSAPIIWSLYQQSRALFGV